MSRRLSAILFVIAAFSAGLATALISGGGAATGLLAVTVVQDNQSSLVVGWAPPAGTAGYEFLVDGKRVSNTWDATRSQAKFYKIVGSSHTYGVVAVVESVAGNVTYPTATTQASTFLSASSAINQPIPAAAAVIGCSPGVACTDPQMLSPGDDWLLGGTSLDAYKEWLGPRERVYYWRGDTTTLPTVPVYVNFKDGAGYQCGAKIVSVPMPSGWANLLGANATTGDRSLNIIDTKTGDVWEGYRVTPPGSASMDTTCGTSRWNAVRLDYHPNGANGTGYGWGYGASASAILMSAGALVPQDFADPAQAVIPHALRINYASESLGTIYPHFVSPAAGYDNHGFDHGPPMGSRIQLDPTIDVYTWPSVVAKAEPWRSALEKILRTLQVYGAIPVDGSGPGAGGIDAATGDSVAPYLFPWQQAGVGWGYSDGIPYDLMSHFRVIDWRVWTGA